MNWLFDEPTNDRFKCPSNRGCTKVDECDRSCKGKKVNGSSRPSKFNEDVPAQSQWDKLKEMLKDLEQK